MVMFFRIKNIKQRIKNEQDKNNYERYYHKELFNGWFHFEEQRDLFGF